MKTTKLLFSLLIASAVIFTACEEDSGTCVDGIQNQGELGIDCGGPCPACTGTSCSDGVMNGNETGIDCGGPDCPACTNNFTAKVNGTDYVAENAFFTFNQVSGTTLISGSRLDQSSITITIQGGSAGTYDLSMGNAIYATPGNSNFFLSTSGSVTITTSSTVLSGTFSFEATEQATGNTVSVTNGVFTDLPEM